MLNVILDSYCARFCLVIVSALKISFRYAAAPNTTARCRLRRAVDTVEVGTQFCIKRSEEENYPPKSLNSRVNLTIIALLEQAKSTVVVDTARVEVGMKLQFRNLT